MKPEFPLTGQTVPVWLFEVLNNRNKWHAYPQPHTDAIEEAYNNHQAFVDFTLNGLKMQIRFGKPREFSHQKCVKNSNGGYFVCKVHRIEVEPEEAEAMMKQAVDPGSICPICRDTFHDPKLSIECLQCCENKIHAKCLQVFLTPPLFCRQSALSIYALV